MEGVIGQHAEPAARKSAAGVPSIVFPAQRFSTNRVASRFDTLYNQFLLILRPRDRFSIESNIRNSEHRVL